MTTPLPGVSEPDTTHVPSGEGPAVLNLTHGRLLAGNAVWNLIGTGFPILVAVACLPVLKRGIGTERLGFISLAWAVIGYFSLFDLGLSRALTKLVAEKLGKRQLDEIPALIWTSLFLMSALGAVGAVVVLLASPWLLGHLLKVPPALYREALYAFYWLSASIPIVLLNAGLRGVLEAFQRFRLATAIRVPLGVFTYLGPVLVLPFSHSLAPIMAVLVAGRVAACIAYLWACFYVMPDLRRGWGIHLSLVGPLFRFGTWMTVSNVVGPFMVTFDRFLIGSMISISAVAYYSVPYEVVTKLWLLPTALVGVLFPAFSTVAEADRDRLVFLFDTGLKYIFIGLLPVTLVLVAFAPEILRLWIGADFASNGSTIARALATAVFINSLAFMPFVQLQSCGRPDITAKLHLFELPLYIVALYFLARGMGIRGVAIAWLLRVAFDATLLFFFSRQILKEDRFVPTRLPWLILGVLGLLAGTAYLPGLQARILLTAGALAVTLPGLWFWMLSPRERGPLLMRFGRGPQSAG